MAKKLTKRQQIARGKRVEKLLENKDLKEAFADVKAAIHQQIDELKPSQIDELILCKERLHVLKSVEANLTLAIKHGKKAEFQILEQDRPTPLGDIHAWRRKKLEQTS